MIKVNKHKLILGVVVVLTITAFVGCWYETEKENHPSGHDRTGVQGWTIYVTVTPATAPANGDAKLSVQAKFWDLEDRVGIAGQAIYLSLWNLNGTPAHPAVVSFPDGSINTQIVTDGLGLVDATLQVGYLPLDVIAESFYIVAEATTDFDNNALYYWDSHYFHIYNPYYDGDIEPTPTPGG